MGLVTVDGYEFGVTHEEYVLKLVNMIYKLLPLREEGKDWKGYLESLIVEIQGLITFIPEFDTVRMLRILCRLDGLKPLVKPEDFRLYRKIVLECVNSIN